MKAVVYHGTKDVRFEAAWDSPRLGSDEVRVKVKAAGICHTDFCEYLYGPLYVAKTPHPRTGRCVPLILGHEFCGQVEETGERVRKVHAGDRVAVNAVDSCRQCEYCHRGLPALCPSAAYIGFSRDGGFAEYAAVPETCCYKLSDKVSDKAGAMVEPLSVALHGVKLSMPGIGSRVAVVGGGTIGLCALQALKVSGTREVFVVEKSEAKEACARRLGATEVVNSSRLDPVKSILELTNGLGVDAAFECVGSQPALSTAIDMTRGGGTICILGVIPRPIEFNFNDLMAREKKLVTSLAYGDEFPTVIAMLGDGRLDGDSLVTRSVPIEEAVGRGLLCYDELTPHNLRTLIQMES